MKRIRRDRIDYEPGPAACDALKIAQSLYPHLSRSALIDRLLITGLSALRHPHWIAPTLHGRDRDAWVLPASLRE